MDNKPDIPQQSTDQPSKNITGKDILAYFKTLTKEILDLDHGVDKWGTINEVKSKQSMSGANAWMLMCSIMIASIGLNLDSQAVIIGAMLISPLMSPILGVGVAVGINDKDALYNALMHFVAAIVIALLTSTIYFFATPLDEFTEQIQARTEPTFLDILIAIFGGIAGIVSIARKDISTTLPGVAIATALMPPLCVTGYGLANSSWDIASKSFYLFFLNSFFVAFATYVIVRYLRFPHRKYASKAERRKNLFIVGLISLIMTIPSIMIFRKVYIKFQDEQKVAAFIDTHIGSNSIFLDDHQLLRYEDGTKRLILKVYGDSIRKDKSTYYEEMLAKMDMTNTEVEVIPTSEINLSKVRQLESQLSEVGAKINTQIIELNNERAERKEMFDKMSNNKDFFNQDSVYFKQICEEVKIFMPQISSLDIGMVSSYDYKKSESQLPFVLVGWDSPQQADEQKLRNYLKHKYELDTIKLVIH